jgi:hypothetical protein
MIYLALAALEPRSCLKPTARRHLGISHALNTSPLSHTRSQNIVVTRVLPLRVTSDQGLDSSPMQDCRLCYRVEPDRRVLCGVSADAPSLRSRMLVVSEFATRDVSSNYESYWDRIRYFR